MLDAAREMTTFVKGRVRQNLDTNRMLVLSLIRSIEIIGEAASQISKECQTKYPAIPWASMIAMRNRLIHAYFDVDLDQVWDTVENDLPPLISQLEIILSEK